MKITRSCYECLRRLAIQAASLATTDAGLRQKAIEEALRLLDDQFTSSQLSIELATKIHKVVRDVTHNPDPYQAMKEQEMSLARRLYAELSSSDISTATADPGRAEFPDYLRLAAAANAIDFFREPQCIREDIRAPINFAIDHTAEFVTRLVGASRVLYLADNAGELYFDIPLVKWLRRFVEVIYVVKPSPVQNDMTLEDVKRSGLESELGKVITTGVASPGIVFSLASAEFRQEFESADLIFAKGMGHYEALSELPREGKFFYCLMAKCQPVADSLGVPINSYVAMLE